MRGSLQLTFIPARYWSSPAAKFAPLTPGAPSPPKESSFFFFWLPNISDVATVESEIARLFPSIPAKKLVAASLVLTVPDEQPKDNILLVRPQTGKIVPIPPMLKILFQLEIVERQDRTMQAITYSSAIKTWAYLTKLTVELLCRGDFVPYLDPIPQNPKQFEGKWRILLQNELDYQRFNALVQHSPWGAYCLPINIIPIAGSNTIQTTLTGSFTTGLWHPSYTFSYYMDVLADYLIRTSLNKDFFAHFEQIYGSKIPDIETACAIDQKTEWELRFLRSVISKNKLFDINRFCDTPIPGILRNWVQSTEGFSFSLGVAFTLRLDYPKDPQSEWNLGFFIQPQHDPDTFIPLREIWSGNITQKEEFANICDENSALQEEILRALGTASRFFPPILRSLDAKNPQHVKLTASEVMDFLRYSMYLLMRAGFRVVLPEQFRERGQQRLTARMSIRPKSTQKATRAAPGTGATSASMFDMNSMMEYHWEATLEGKPLTDHEFLELANAQEPLIYWRGQWVLVDQQDMDTLRPIFEEGQTAGGMKIQGDLSMNDALKLGMVGSLQLQEDGTPYEVALEGDFQGVIEQISHIESLAPIPVPATFTGKLRPYQERALTWLGHMAGFQFGICLADDMGLGKTVEVIAFLAFLKERHPELGSTLIICPTSLLFNWLRELQKFAPKLEVVIHHGGTRIQGEEMLTEFTRPNRIILTTYGTIRSDLEALEPLFFGGIIVDESQNIKNYKSQQTQAIYRLKSQYRIALSGTPIENRLLELWTLFQFLNPGLLGTRTEFQTNFVGPIERFHDEAVAKRLQKFIGPFLLRRLKTDKQIIQDLPEKNEMKIHLTLSPEQAQLYKTTVDSTFKQMEGLQKNDIRRKGLVLRLLMQVKQICNHPFQFLHIHADQLTFDAKSGVKTTEVEERMATAMDGDLSPADQLDIEKISLEDFIGASVKLQRLVEMIEEVLEDGEKILIFTQFKQMGDILQHALEKYFKLSVLFFHGGVPEKQRRELVDEFQSSTLDSSPIMILSLKAGGTGLNLTRASTVFHYDRWWNPAVENQATDRAYRIGQTSRVNVYKYISVGTIEEKIDQILNEKRNLADTILSSTGETWITNLSNDELQELFSLSKPKSKEI